jgi:hypothetical protein
MLTIAGRLDRWDALIRSEAAKQRHSVAQVLTQLTIVSKPTLLGLLANKYGLKPVCSAMERKMLIRKSPVRGQAAAPGAAQRSRVQPSRWLPVRRQAAG